MTQPFARFEFIGHKPTPQGLQSEGAFTHVETVGKWWKGDVHTVIDEVARWLRATHCFRELSPDDPRPDSPLEWQRPVTPEPSSDTPTEQATPAPTPAPAPKPATSTQATPAKKPASPVKE